MAILDPTSSLGKVRLRTGDWHDIVILPDVVIQSTLDDYSGSVTQAAQRCAMYILATLTSKSHKKVGLLEVWGSETFNNYVTFLEKTVLNPHLTDICPIPYAPALETNPLVEIQTDWAAGYTPGAVVLPPWSVIDGQTFPTIITHEPT